MPLLLCSRKALELYIVDEIVPFVDFAPKPSSLMNHRYTVWILFALCCCFSSVKAQRSPATQLQQMESREGSQVIQTGMFLKFLSDLEAVGLGKLMHSKEQFTVFLPEGGNQSLSESLESSPGSNLRAHLTYHIVAGKITAAELLSRLCHGEGETYLTTLQGAQLEVRMKGTDILLIDKKGRQARITKADIPGANGVVHQVDQILSYL